MGSGRWADDGSALSMLMQLRSTVQRVINRLIAKDAPGELANQGLGDISPLGKGWSAGSGEEANVT